MFGKIRDLDSSLDSTIYQLSDFGSSVSPVPKWVSRLPGLIHIRAVVFVH